MGFVTHYDWSAVPLEQLNDKLFRRVVHTGKLTVARLELRRGAIVPEHRHVNEQFSMIESGSLKFIVDGREVVVRAGEALSLPSMIPHSAEATEDCVAIDVFTPPRQDWISGDDAYLRGR
jgi:quercetin dioxygenase-like cupin family protein